MSAEFARLLIANLTKRIDRMPCRTYDGRINGARLALKEYKRAIIETMKEMGHTL